MTTGTTTTLTVAQQELLRLVAEERAPVTIAELSAKTGRHPNSVRELMATLLRAGQVQRHKTHAPARGRPAWAYVASTPAEPDFPTQLAELSAALSTVLVRVSSDPEPEAYAIGVEWAREYGEAHPGPAAGELPLTWLAERMSELGYDPRAVDGERLELDSCPLRVGGGAPHPLVCQMHRGLVDGLLGRAGSVVKPLVRPNLCVIELSEGQLSETGAG